MFEVRDHRLWRDGRPVEFVPAAHVGGRIEHRWLVMHFTGGGFAEALDTLRTGGGRSVSAHLLVGEDGRVVQMVPFDRKANHCGDSRWQGTRYLNGTTIGIEIANYGEVDLRPDGSATFAGHFVPKARVLKARHKNGARETGWQTYPAEQLAVVEAIGRALHAAYRFRDVLGHDDIAPERKVDPGPAFPMAAMRAAILSGPASGTSAPAAPPPAAAAAEHPDADPDFGLDAPAVAPVPTDLVKAVQERLRALGYFPGLVDGEAPDAGLTRQAVVAAKFANRWMPVDGAITPDFVLALMTWPPKPLGEARRTATADDLPDSRIVTGAREVETWAARIKRAVLGFFGLGAAAGGTITANDALAAKSTVQALVQAFGPWLPWLAGAALAAAALWWVAGRLERSAGAIVAARVDDHRTGRTP